MSDSQKFRSRLYAAVLYPDDDSHVACMEKLQTNGYNFAAILHDKDVYEDGDKKGELKKPHWHLVLRFKNAVWKYYPFLILCTQSYIDSYLHNGSSTPLGTPVFVNGLYFWGVYSWSTHSSSDDYFAYCTGWDDLGVVSGFSDWKTFCKSLTLEDLEGSISTSLDLTLGEIAPAGSTIAEGYSVWNQNAMLVTDEDGSQKYVYPITLTETYEDSLSITQEDVWAGVGSTYVDSTTGTDTETGTGTTTGTATIADVISAIKAIPQSIADFFTNIVTAVQAIPAAIADLFIPSADIGTFTISLSDYF